MEEKEYAECVERNGRYRRTGCIDQCYFKFSQQMLIGYMIEYLKAKGKYHVLACDLRIGDGIETIYNYLEKQINEIGD